MEKQWQIITEDRDMRLSTVEMPDIGYDFGYKYETCLFGPNDSNVQARYQTKDEAIRGHNITLAKLGMKVKTNVE
jgi:hypothetical protein